jgi:peptidoglycan/LPS O-acetylase OafA/YrhL
MAPVGAISYALYALGRPIQELVIRHSQSLPPNFFSYLLCTAVITVIAVMLSCYMDLRFYPQLRDWLRRRRKAGA